VGGLGSPVCLRFLSPRPGHWIHHQVGTKDAPCGKHVRPAIHNPECRCPGTQSTKGAPKNMSLHCGSSYCCRDVGFSLLRLRSTLLTNSSGVSLIAWSSFQPGNITSALQILEGRTMGASGAPLLARLRAQLWGMRQEHCGYPALASETCGQEVHQAQFRPLVFVTGVHSDIGRGRTLGKSVTPDAGPQAEFRWQRAGNCNESQKCHSEVLAKAAIGRERLEFGERTTLLPPRRCSDRNAALSQRETGQTEKCHGQEEDAEPRSAGELLRSRASDANRSRRKRA
jgi:hypothetical protein